MTEKLLTLSLIILCILAFGNQADKGANVIALGQSHGTECRGALKEKGRYDIFCAQAGIEERQG